MISDHKYYILEEKFGFEKSEPIRGNINILSGHTWPLCLPVAENQFVFNCPHFISRNYNSHITANSL
jgi:hypothetical protein